MQRWRLRWTCEMLLIAILTVPSDSVDWKVIKEEHLVNAAECDEGGYAQQDTRSDEVQLFVMFDWIVESDPDNL